jgi:hypothetical protein
MLSLFFIVMVQVVIMAEWFVLNMPIGTIQTHGNLHCDVPKVSFCLQEVCEEIFSF